MAISPELAATIQRLRSSINSVFLGKEAVVDGALVALLSHGHILIEDVPGVGKTLLARAIAKTLAVQFRRVQFTPDLLPSDIIGSNIYHSSTGEFQFKEGPVFTNVLLADEINRTSPRTQSALLEAMNSAHVSVDGITRPLPSPFLVLATQNPFEFEGTYALPESQLDRFMVRLTVGYPPREEERRLLAQHRQGEPVDSLTSVVSGEELLAAQTAVRAVQFDHDVADYLLDVVHATRVHEEIQVGVSTRGAIMLYQASQARAVLQGRDFVVPDDVKQLALPVLAHRIITRAFVQRNSVAAAETILTGILQRIAVPD